MTKDDVRRHWQEGARHELHAAQVLAEGGEYASALFHCHLAVEKAMKSQWVERKETEPPYTHNLVALSEHIGGQWSEEEKVLLGELSHYSAAARYADALWMNEQATKETCEHWIGFVQNIIPKLLP